MTVADLIGLTGVAAYLTAYALLQLRTLAVDDPRYLGLNAFGGVTLLYSLIFNFNLAAFVTQTLWLAFTAIGYFRGRRLRSLA
ncbi:MULTISPECIES: hypothetical protein [unclassified Aureimonas]|uniref:CBU_0592 family membrane protein n=1 Tax=unclassified Aureimonas TaxID=2615206 RepID=UPI0007228C34|nr:MULTISPECIES: hypothetical protein [unclassified Aureimonas]ALN74673.1 hypothetical protein M673_18295 [Aureimonas sp. AU20]